MTTETKPQASTPTPDGSGSVSSSPVRAVVPGAGSGLLLRAGAATLVLVLALAGTAALTAGAPGAAGALVGGGLALSVLLLGSLSVNLVAGVMPSFSLLFALMTYLLQLLVLAVAFAALTGSGAVGRELHREWLGGAIVAVTLSWLVVQVVLTLRTRIPVYDLPTEAGSDGASRPGAR